MVKHPKTSPIVLSLHLKQNPDWSLSHDSPGTDVITLSVPTERATYFSIWLCQQNSPEKNPDFPCQITKLWDCSDKPRPQGYLLGSLADPGGPGGWRWLECGHGDVGCWEGSTEFAGSCSYFPAMFRLNSLLVSTTLTQFSVAKVRSILSDGTLNSVWLLSFLNKMQGTGGTMGYLSSIDFHLVPLFQPFQARESAVAQPFGGQGSLGSLADPISLELGVWRSQKQYQMLSTSIKSWLMVVNIDV